MSERFQQAGAPYGTPSTALRPLSRRELESRIQRVTADIALAFSNVEPVTIRYLGEEIQAIPLDTRRFVRLMSRHISLN